MTAEALAGVLESIAFAIRALPGAQAVNVAAAIPAPAPMPAPPAVITPPPAPIHAPAAEPEPAPAEAAPAEAPVPAAAAAADVDSMAEWLKTFRSIIKDRGYSAQTLKNRGTCINYIEYQLGSRPLRAIKPHEIATVLKKCSPHKAGRVLMELRDIYVEAIANGTAEVNPAAHVKKPPAPGLRKRLTLETWQAMHELAKAGPQRWVPAMLLLGLHTGQRRADLAKMRFGDVVDGHLRIEQQKKARKKVGARLAIPLSLRLRATGMTLGDVIELCRTIGKPGDTMLRQANGRPIEMSSLSARFREHIVTVCGPEAYKQFEWPSLHEVRSLAARTYISEGMAASTVQTLLGHKHAEMTALYLDDRGLSATDWKTVQGVAGAAA
ncbi:MAG: tyrosine-type recombinase/integrase [Roseateles sp.]